ncbi:MAG: hypothetical protein AB2L14_10905 [Candidatus Xenobiia bacterium LiM19]
MRRAEAPVEKRAEAVTSNSGIEMQMALADSRSRQEMQAPLMTSISRREGAEDSARGQPLC